MHLWHHFVFKVVPMINPDGVVIGNTRVNLAGCDMKHKWHASNEQLFPTIYHLKQQLAHFRRTDGSLCSAICIVTVLTATSL